MISVPKTLACIEHIRTLPAKLEVSIESLNNDQLDTPYRDGGWTVRQVVHHIADSHCNAIIRMKLVITETNPILKPYEQDKWAELPDSKVMPIDISLDLIRSLHGKWAYLLDNLTDDELLRTGSHLDDGVVTLAALIHGYSRHGINHVLQITQLREKMGWIR